MSKSPSQIPAQVVRKVGPDLETVLQHILSGQSVYPSRIVCFDPGENRRHLRCRRCTRPASRQRLLAALQDLIAAEYQLLPA
jgi:hypothetical protein